MDPEARFPATHTTATTSANTSGDASIRFDPSYVRTLPGTLKCMQMIMSLCGFICISVAQRSNAHNANWFAFVAFGGLLITFILFLLFLFHLIEKLHFLPWLLIELVYCAIWTFFYFTAATAAASMGHIEDPFAAAAFFGYTGMLLYGFDTYLKYISWKAGEIAQGGRVENKSATSTVNNH